MIIVYVNIFLTYIMKLSCTGVAVGAGWQSIVAYVNIACYYLVGIPVGVVLGYVFNMGVKVSYLYSLSHSCPEILCFSNI